MRNRPCYATPCAVSGSRSREGSPGRPAATPPSAPRAAAGARPSALSARPTIDRRSPAPAAAAAAARGPAAGSAKLASNRKRTSAQPAAPESRTPRASEAPRAPRIRRAGRARPGAARPQRPQQHALAHALSGWRPPRPPERRAPGGEAEEGHEADRQRHLSITLDARCTSARSSVGRSEAPPRPRAGAAPRGRVVQAVRVTKVWGAPSSGPSGNTAKKFGSKRAHSTSRRPRCARHGTPWTSHTIASPTPRRARGRLPPRPRSAPVARGAPSTRPALHQRARHHALGSRRAPAVAAAVLAAKGPALRRCGSSLDASSSRDGRPLSDGDTASARSARRARYDPAAPRRARRRVALVGLDVEEHEVGSIRRRGHAQVAQQVVLHEEEGERAGRRRSRERGSPSASGSPADGGWRGPVARGRAGARGKPAQRRAPDRGRRAKARGSRWPMPAAKPSAAPSGPPGESRGHADGERRARPPGGGVAPARAAARRRAQQSERRDAPHREQRNQREDQRHPDAEADAAERPKARRARRRRSPEGGRRGRGAGAPGPPLRGPRRPLPRSPRPRPEAGTRRTPVAPWRPGSAAPRPSSMRASRSTCTALATPSPPSSRARRPPDQGSGRARPRVSLRRRWSSATVRMVTRSGPGRAEAVGQPLRVTSVGSAGTPRSARASRSARRPVRATRRAERRRAARARRVPRRRPAVNDRGRDRERASPSVSVSPTEASRITSRDGSTSAPPFSASRAHSRPARSRRAVEGVARLHRRELHEAACRAAGREAIAPRLVTRATSPAGRGRPQLGEDRLGARE